MSQLDNVKRRTILGGMAGGACSLYPAGHGALGGEGAAAPLTFYPLVAEEPKGLQYGGRFFGCLESADQAGNIFFTKGYPGVIRFRVERTGDLAAFRWAMRYQTGKPGENTGYSRGGGGLIKAELRKVVGDTAEAAIPDMAPSGLVAETVINNGQTVPLVGSGGNPVWAFTQPVRVTKGTTLCLVFHQYHDTDWLSINGGWQEAPGAFGTAAGRNGPWYGDAWAGMKGDIVNRWGNRWYYRNVTTPYINFHYTDGVVTGSGTGFSSETGIKEIGGPAMARQRFLVTGYDRVVDALWLRVWNEGGAATAPLSIDLEHEGGGLILNRRVAVSRLAPVTFGTTPIDWTLVYFPSPITLLRNQSYQLRLSSAAPGYRINAAQDYLDLGYNSIDRWPSTSADFSLDGGASWYGWTIPKWNPNQYRKDMRMHIAFRIARSTAPAAMPR